MAKIVYGISGEGFGHAIRSRVLIEHLQKNHEIQIVAGGKAFVYLSKHFDNIIKVEFLKIEYIKNSISNIRVILSNIKNAAGLTKSYVKVKRILNNFKPDLVISDFETLTAYNAYYLGIPVVSVDNIQQITKCKLNFPKKYFNDFIKTKIVVKMIMPFSNYNLIMAYSPLKVNDNNSIITPPLIREEIKKLKTKKEDFVLVYQTSKSNKKLLKILREINQSFVVYGFNKEDKFDNIELRKFNEEKFYDDLKNCKALITNGGFSLISEALYLRKPILSIPIKKTFEQIINAVNLKKTLCGQFVEKTTKENLDNFLNDLDFYERCIKSHRRKIKFDNKIVFKKTDKIIKQILKYQDKAN
tara:strand:- start:3032 stop:4102 length:1071 start_codon:yes stop_codon:yes gene_type:complete